ncbi:MAG: FAD-binding oxidoreductase [Gammaproteobacteria bacterium]|nr:FAD-binding oxidoreductase [Gammaproteobacteria bacterium]
MKKPAVTVLGAGIVGICCAIELQRSGYQVDLIDRREPASETSYGNAGIFSLGSIAPLASPALLSRLPGLAANRYTDFRLHYPHFLQLLPWMLAFLKRCNRNTYFKDGELINRLTVASVKAHQDLIKQSGAEHLALHNGGLRLYRQEKTFEKDALERELFRRYQVEYEVLDGEGIRKLEPDLNNRFVKGVWVNQTISIKDPQALCQHYARYFESLGGQIKQLEVKGIQQVGDCWQLQYESSKLQTPKLVLCLGAWTPMLLKPLGYRNVIAIERGYHSMLAPQPGKVLNRPIFDVDCNYVMAPMSAGLRVSTGSNLTYRETKPTPKQIDQVLPHAREAFPLGEALIDEPWMGRRPSTPDSKPIIGPAPRHQNLWLAYAHAHMGLGMGPITGQIIASQVAGKAPPLDVAGCSPNRFF